MKLLVLALAPLLLVSCKPKESAPEAPQEETAEQKLSRNVEIAKLLNQKMDLAKQLDRLTAAKKLDPVGEMQIVLQEKLQAENDLVTIRRSHPSLQKLNKDLTFWRSNEMAARASNRESEKEEATQQILEINGKIHNLTQELPAIREAEDRIARSTKQIEDLRRSLAEKSPEGKILLEKIKEIESQIKSN